MPFLVVEVADSEGYAHAFEKGRRSVLAAFAGSNRVPDHHEIGPRRARRVTTREGSGPQESSQHKRVGSNKRVAGNHSSQTVGKKARTTTLPPKDTESVQNSASDAYRNQDSPVSQDPPQSPKCACPTAATSTHGVS